MMSKEKAAQYLIVAWVKDWSMQMYFYAIKDGDENLTFGNVNEHYNFLPKNPTIFIRNIPARRFIADNFKSTNDKLWDCKDKSKMIKFSDDFLSVKIGSGKLKTMDSVAECKKAESVYRQSVVSFQIDNESRKKSLGTDWKTCK